MEPRVDSSVANLALIGDRSREVGHFRPTWTRTWECGVGRLSQRAVALATSSPRITAPLCMATKTERKKQSHGRREREKKEREVGGRTGKDAPPRNYLQTQKKMASQTITHCAACVLLT